MNGGDIDVIFTADDKDVAAGLERLKQKAGGFAGEWSKATAKVKEQFTGFKNLGPAVGGAIAAGFALSTKAVLDYSQKNDMVAGSLNRMKLASDNLWTGMGRDISGLLGGEAADFLRWVESARTSIVNGLVFWKDTDGIDGAMKATENMIKGAKEAALIRREELQIRAAMLESEGKSVESAKIRALLEKESTLERINGMNLTNSAEKAGLIKLAEAKRLQDVRKAEQDLADRNAANIKANTDAMIQIEAQLDREDAAKREAVELDKQARAAAKERLELDLAGYEIDALRGARSKEEIATMERELDLRRKITDIRSNDLLSAADKDRAINTLRNLTAIETANIKPDRDRGPAFTQFEAGINAGGAALAAAGSGAVLPVQVATRDAAVRTAKAVEKIAEKGLSARFA
jgi:hypothetical protein